MRYRKHWVFLPVRKKLPDVRLLKKMLEREHMTPNANDLSGVLTAGTFSQQNERVTGIWPIERGFLESLLNRP